MLGEQPIRQTRYRADRTSEAASGTLRSLNWTHILTPTICMYSQ